MSSNTSLWPAPAKLNLFLHITGRRADGYHDLQTVFQFLDYADELRFTPRKDGLITAVPTLPDVVPAANLIVRAAHLLQATAKINRGVDIELTKRIPMGGGLGGGSSNAATTLVALNRLWELHYSVGQLARLGLSLGADVPVFIQGHAAWAEGIGEQLTSVSLKEPWYLVIVPPCRVSTQAIFAAADLTRNSKPITIADFLAGLCGNDCEALVARRYPEVADALRWLGQYAKARMTGTGGCVFAAFDDEADAQSILRRFAEERSAPWQGFVAKGMNQSSLQHSITIL